MRVIKLSRTWLQVLSELLINLAAGLLIILFIEPIIVPAHTWIDYILLTYKVCIAIVFLVLAKKFRE